MHITAMNPSFIKPEDVSADVVEKKKEIWKEQLAAEKKPAEIIEKILAGKEKIRRNGSYDSAFHKKSGDHDRGFNRREGRQDRRKYSGGGNGEI